MILSKVAVPMLGVLALAVTGCGGDEALPADAVRPETSAPRATPSSSPSAVPSLAPTPADAPTTTPSAAPSAVTPSRTDFTQCLGVPSDTAACNENLPEPGEG